MNIAIIGSRKFRNRYLVKRIVRQLYSIFNICVVSGGCKNSPDEYAEDIAKNLEIESKIFLPKTNNTKGYFARNKLIAENSDFLVAFIPRNQLRSGAWNTIKWMKQKKSQNSYIVLDEDGERWDR